MFMDSVNMEKLAIIVESLLFVASTPVAVEHLARTLDISPGEVDGVLAYLAAASSHRGIRLQRKGNEVQLVTAPDAAPYVEKFLGIQLSARLSPAALETLAIIAYRQPITRAQIEALRGVNSEGVLATLIARGLITEVGRLETVGHPILYGTTFEFLRYFGLPSIEALPPVDLPPTVAGTEQPATRDTSAPNSAPAD
jgi:segregation and condensation protein B